MHTANGGSLSTSQPRLFPTLDPGDLKWVADIPCYARKGFEHVGMPHVQHARCARWQVHHRGAFLLPRSAALGSDVASQQGQLLTGLQRYFQRQRAEGLLSSQASAAGAQDARRPRLRGRADASAGRTWALHSAMELGCVQGLDVLILACEMAEHHVDVHPGDKLNLWALVNQDVR